MTLSMKRIFISGTPLCLRNAAYPATRLSTSMTPPSPQSSLRMSVTQLRQQYAGFYQVQFTGPIKIVKPKSQVPSPKVKAKGLGMTIKSHGPPTPPITFKHEGVLW